MPGHSYTVSRTLHWAIAACIVAALVFGYALTNANSFSPALLVLHLTSGALAGGLTVVRLLAWAVSGPPPSGYPAPEGLQAVAVKLVHGLLRILPLLLLISGIGMMAISGAFDALTDGSLKNLARLEDLPPRALHHAAGFAIAVFTGLHALAGLRHWLQGTRLKTG